MRLQRPSRSSKSYYPWGSWAQRRATCPGPHSESWQSWGWGRSLWLFSDGALLCWTQSQSVEQVRLCPSGFTVSDIKTVEWWLFVYVDGVICVQQAVSWVGEMMRMRNFGIWVLGCQGKGKLSCSLTHLGKARCAALMEKGAAHLLGAGERKHGVSEGKYGSLGGALKVDHWGHVAGIPKGPGHRPGTGEFSGMLCPVLGSMRVALGLPFPVLWLQIEE